MKTRRMEVDFSIRTDWKTDIKTLTVALNNFAKAPNKICLTDW